MSEKLCIFCQHMEINTSGMYGDYPDPATIECGKGKLKKTDEYWGGNSNSQAWFSEDEFRRIILSAVDCSEYKQVKP